MADDDVEVVYSLKTDDLYIAFHPNVSDDIIAQWQHTLDDVKQSPLYQEMIHTFLQKYM